MIRSVRRPPQQELRTGCIFSQGCGLWSRYFQYVSTAMLSVDDMSTPSWNINCCFHCELRSEVCCKIKLSKCWNRDYPVIAISLRVDKTKAFSSLARFHLRLFSNIVIWVYHSLLLPMREIRCWHHVTKALFAAEYESLCHNNCPFWSRL